MSNLNDLTVLARQELTFTVQAARRAVAIASHRLVQKAMPDRPGCSSQPNLPPYIRLKPHREFLLLIIYEFENILIFISRLYGLYFSLPVDSQF
ncbi:hypothetical protein [Burkholderia ubonensis]|uniref:hypothetical protein n=1 Tax=Burkholderia ubonensis TaxID=101571 RepID=UPI000B14C4E1|nr:hypothetical protein [Burkholderia ubonensis]